VILFSFIFFRENFKYRYVKKQMPFSSAMSQSVSDWFMITNLWWIVFYTSENVTVYLYWI
jgi:hypothetical protein